MTTFQIKHALYAIVEREHPITVRGAFYRAVSAGLFPGTQDEHYKRCVKLIQELRKRILPPKIPYEWIIDSSRTRNASAGVDGPETFFDAVIDSYARNYWLEQPVHVEVMTEKDAMATILHPVTKKWSAPFTVFRGNPSDTICHQIGTLFSGGAIDEEDYEDSFTIFDEILGSEDSEDSEDQIDKPVVVLYLGDHDPSGLNISKVARAKIEKFAKRQIEWTRVAVTTAQFEEMKGQFGIPVKPGDKLGPAYTAKYGDLCVEVDAIPSDEIRDMLAAAITQKIDMELRKESKAEEEEERKKIETLVQKIRKQFK